MVYRKGTIELREHTSWYWGNFFRGFPSLGEKDSRFGKINEDIIWIQFDRSYMGRVQDLQLQVNREDVQVRPDFK